MMEAICIGLALNPLKPNDLGEVNASASVSRAMKVAIATANIVTTLFRPAATVEAMFGRSALWTILQNVGIAATRISKNLGPLCRARVVVGRHSWVKG